MKRIVIEQDETIALNDVDNTLCVGIQWESDQKAIIIRTAQGYCSMSNYNIPNIMNVWYADTLQEYVERSLKQGNNTNSKAFVFNNTKELYKWLSK